VNVKSATPIDLVPEHETDGHQTTSHLGGIARQDKYEKIVAIQPNAARGCDLRRSADLLRSATLLYNIRGIPSWLEQQYVRIQHREFTPQDPWCPFSWYIGNRIIRSLWIGDSPHSDATCASFFGIGNSAECTSNLLSWAIAVGDEAEAHANGTFGGAFVIGENNTGATGAGSIFNLAISAFGSNNSATAEGAIANFATNIGGNDNTVQTTGSLFNTATNILGSGNTVTTRAGYVNWARNVFGDNNIITVNGGVANWARNAFGDNNNIVLQGGNANTARNIFGSDNKYTLQGATGILLETCSATETPSRHRSVIQT
jgi:hypothetical protein